MQAWRLCSSPPDPADLNKEAGRQPVKPKAADPWAPLEHSRPLPQSQGHWECPAASQPLLKPKLNPHLLEVLFKHRLAGVSYDKTRRFYRSTPSF